MSDRGSSGGVGNDGLRHEALLFASEDELLEVAVPFLRDAAARGEPTLLRLQPALQDALLDAVDDPEAVTLLPRDGPLTPLAALRETHDALTRALALGGRARMIGDVPLEPSADWARYEAATNLTLASLPVWTMCAYDTRAAPADVLHEVERTHATFGTSDLAGQPSHLFEDPLTFLDDHARRTAPAPSAKADVELLDPSPARAADTVGILADDTRLEPEDRDNLRLATKAVVANAHVHGLPPVLVRVWSRADRVVVTVADGGLGTNDLLAGVLLDGASVEDARTLYHVREIVSHVSMFWGADGFTVRLVQERR